MIWPFRPHPPIPLLPKVLYERRIGSFARWLGRSRIDPNHTIITPQDIDSLIKGSDVDQWPERFFHFFRARMPGSAAGLEMRWRTVEEEKSHDKPTSFDLLSNEDGSIASGLFHRSLAQFPYRMAAVTAEAAAKHFMVTAAENERHANSAADVLPVFFGFGPVLANATLLEFEEHSSAGMHQREGSRTGAVSALEYGYCMALSDWALGTNYGTVVDQLRPDAKEGLLKGLRFLQKTQDCSFERDRVFDEVDLTMQTLNQRLQNSSKSIQLATLLDLAESGDVSSEVAALLHEPIESSEPEIACAAAAVLGRCTDIPAPVFDALLAQAEFGAPTVSRAAVTALQPTDENDERVKDLLTDRLRGADPALATACINSLLRFDRYPESLSDALLRALGKLVSAASEAGMNCGLQLLKKIEDSPLDAIQSHFEDDPTAVAILSEHLVEA